MIEYRDAAARFRTRDEGRTTWHSFSFGAHYDPANTGFARLVAHNDEQLPPGTGYADHPHTDVEIVTWVLSGALRHTSTVGTGVIGPGQVQRLSAGTGVVHAEVNDTDVETRFLQAWVRPDEDGLAPSYLARQVDPVDGWTCIADGDGRGVAPLASAGTSLHTAHLAHGQRLDLPEAASLHVFVAEGEVQLGERVLKAGDAARLLDEGGRQVTGESTGETAGHLVVWAFRG